MSFILNGNVYTVQNLKNCLLMVVCIIKVVQNWHIDMEVNTPAAIPNGFSFII